MELSEKKFKSSYILTAYVKLKFTGASVFFFCQSILTKV